MAPRISKDRIERVARIYKSNIDAAAALDISPGSFSRLCRRYGVATPLQRRQSRAKGAFDEMADTARARGKESDNDKT